MRRTGNFVKVVQRVPVKNYFRRLSSTDHTLGPGLSVTPSVQVSKWAVPSVVLALVAIVISIVAALDLFEGHDPQAR